MLVILNGAPKGGSTWLVQIIASLKLFKRVPSKYQDRKWLTSSIDSAKLDDFLSDVRYETENYYCKQHWSGQAKHKQILAHENIKILNIVRETKDVLVSRYFHDLRLENAPKNISIDDYYWNHSGKANISSYIEYQKFWHDNESPENQPFLCGYERLHNDFYSQVFDLFNYLGFIEMKASDIKTIQEETSFENKKLTGEGEFFRKGIVGDWKNYLSMPILEDLKTLCRNKGYFDLQQKMSRNFNLSLPEENDFAVK
jgi:hypothetical protein